MQAAWHSASSSVNNFGLDSHRFFYYVVRSLFPFLQGLIFFHHWNVRLKLESKMRTSLFGLPAFLRLRPCSSCHVMHFAGLLVLISALSACKLPFARFFIALIDFLEWIIICNATARKHSDTFRGIFFLHSSFHNFFFLGTLFQGAWFKVNWCEIISPDCFSPFSLT